MSNHFKEAIFVVTPSPDFRPTSPWNWPEDFTGGRLVKKNTSMQDARAYARTFNATQMQSGRPIREWAIAARFLRRRNRAPYRPESETRAEAVTEPMELVA